MTHTSTSSASMKEEEEEEPNNRRQWKREESNGNDGSNEDDGDEEEDDNDDSEDSAQGLPKGGLSWQSDRSAYRSASDSSPVPSINIAAAVQLVRVATPEVEQVEATPDAVLKEKEGPSSSSNKRKRKDLEREEQAEKEPEETPSSPGADAEHGPPSKLNEYQRQLRNAREKRRSGKICDQFDTIRDTMVRAGVIVPKGTKGTILAAAKEYIALLQEQQRRVALDNCLLVAQVQRIGEGALGAPACDAVRHVAQKNGVANIVWPNATSVTGNTNNQNQLCLTVPNNNKENQQHPEKVPTDYAGAFRNSPVAMAIATLGGSFMDCNQQFSQATQWTKPQVTNQTIFTLVDPEELTNAFDRISQWLFSMNGQQYSSECCPQPILLKSIVQDNQSNPMQVCLTPVKEKETMRYLCVTLTARPPTTDELIDACGSNDDVPLSLSYNTSNKKQQTKTSFYAIG